MRARSIVLRSSVCVAAVAALLSIAGAASAQDAATAPQPQQAARFNMVQNGKKMTADDFDKFMQAQGYQHTAPAPEPEKKVAKASPKKKTAAHKKVVAKKKATVAKKPAVKKAK